MILFECRVAGIPGEVLSRAYGDNCLDRVRSHFKDLAAGSSSVTDVKLIVLGNGRVGKTQICRRLRDEPYDEAEKSTHGVLVTSATLGRGKSGTTRLNIWDFGGQDLYHGTHALFLRTRAIFMLVWARETEDAREHTHEGIIFRNQQLPYWLAYVRHLGAANSPVAIAQTRCDRATDEALAPPVTEDEMRPFPHRAVVHYSARNNRGRGRLNQALRESIGWLREHHGTARIGTGRLAVQRKLQDMRDADANVPPEQRQYRTIAQEHFRLLCEEAGNVSSPDHLLDYLHHAGIVFHRPGLFHDSIVLDQGWALDAIYAVFNREKCYRELKRLRGRFTRPLLELLVWGEHSVAEQRLFLGMMRSCGICFAHRGDRYGPENDDDTEYIAPDLLPERETIQAELDSRWNPDLPTETVAFEYEMLHPGLVRGIIGGIGAEAGVDALYWRGGVCVYETETRGHALIEQRMTDAWHGSLILSTQGGQAAVLRDRLAAWIEDRNDRDGLRAKRTGPEPATRFDDAAPPHFGAATPDAAAKPDADAPPGRFGPPPASEPEYFVSYAWGDTTPEGIAREAVVNRLCESARSRGITVIRDRDTLRTGDRISPFMRRIGRGDRVFVILSDKYLRSPFCMFELSEVWFHSRRDPDDFRRRVRVYALPDGRPGTPLERARIAAYWKAQHDELAALIKERGAGILATADFQRFKDMQTFAHHVPDILALMFDIVQPRSFEDLERYGFDDPPT